MYPSLSRTLSPINSHLQKKKKSFLQGSLGGEANHYLRLVPYIEVDDQLKMKSTVLLEVVGIIMTSGLCFSVIPVYANVFMQIMCILWDFY